MAWLDDSPVRNAEKRNLGLSASFTGHAYINNFGKLGVFHQIPLFRKAYGFYRSLFMSRLLHQKLNEIERKIGSNKLDRLETSTALLLEILQAKKLSNHKRLTHLRGKIHPRILQLRQTLIQKSHQAVIEVDDEKPVKKESYKNSHERVLSLIGQKVTEKTNQVKHLPVRVYWRHGHSIFEHSYRRTEGNSTLVYLHTSCHQKLFDLLANTSNSLLPHGDIKVCNEDFLSNREGVDYGVSLKLQPTLSSEEKTISPFWQQPVVGVEVLSKLGGRAIKDHIDKVFFKTSHHYENFKALLTKNKEHELLHLITTLEAKSHIVIQQTNTLALA